MAIIVDGKKIADQILTRLKARIIKERLKPFLAVVLVGDNGPSATYVRKKQEAAESIGVKFSLHKFSALIDENRLIKEIKNIQKQKLTGIIVQLPLPKKLDKKKVLNALNPEIDVDFLTWESLGKLVIADNTLMPPSPAAILEILRYHKVDLRGKNVVLVGMGDLIGKPLINILMHLPLTLTACNKDTKDLAKATRSADILITGVGQTDLIRGNMVSKGVVVIDAGTSFVEGKIRGDVNFNEVTKIASIITPTPGGVGPITVAKLLENTVLNTKNK